MAVVDVPVAPPDAGPLHRLIRRTRLLLRITRVATGLALTAGLFLGALAFVVAADLLLPLLQLSYHFAHGCDVGLRVAALTLVVAPTAVVFVVGVLFPLFRRLTADHVARRIEARLPGIHNRLVSCIDLEARGRAASSPVFYRRLVGEALDRIRGFRPGRVLDFINLRRAGLAAIVGAAAFALVCGLFWNQMPTALARIIHPFDDIPPVGAATFTVQPRGGDFLSAEPIEFSAEVTRGKPAGLTLQLWAADGASLEFPLAATPDDPSSYGVQVNTRTIAKPFQDGFDYRVWGGGTWSDRYHIRLLPRPVITAVETSVYYPAYMGIPTPHPTPPSSSEIVGPEGGEIEAAITVDGQATTGELQLLKPGTRKIPLSDQDERVWFKTEPPAGAAPGPVWDHEQQAGRAAHTDAPSGQAVHRHGFQLQEHAKGFILGQGDALFTYVFIDPEQPPEEIVLEWSDDGKTWNHRACWGADRIKEGEPNTASRRLFGALPPAGRWVRLEAPASAVGLEGATAQGMEFVLKGGRCWWGDSGAVRLEEPAYLADKTFAMHKDEKGRWLGRLPLEGKGAFRAEFRNERGDASRPMQEISFSAVQDQPPTIELTQPQAKDLTLSDPWLTLTVHADDDYGLADVTLFTRPDGAKDYDKPGRVVRHFDEPARNQTVTVLFKELEGLKKGKINYCLEASDRKGQTARTEATVTIDPDAAAANPPKPEFDKAADTFVNRFVQLIAEQKKVQADVDKVSAQYAELTDKVRKAQEAARPTPPADPTKPPAPPKEGPKLDPETAKELADLQKKMADLAREQEKNAQTASQLNNDLAKAADDAGKMQTMPQPLVQEMQGLQQAFQQTAVNGMQNLTQQFSQGANPQARAPDLKDIGRQTDRLTKDLEGLKNRMEAIDDARKGVRADLEKALADLRQKILNENGQLTERDLQELRDFLARMREQIKDLQNQQQNLHDAVEKGGDVKDVQQKQEDLDRQMEKLLEATRKMLDAKRNPRRRPTFPNEPNTPDGDEEKAPPKDQDSDAPLPNAKKPGDKDVHPGDKKPDDAKDDEKDPLDMPALGGPRQVPDPRFEKKRRPVEKKPGDKDDDRDALESHQNDRMRDLDTADKSLASDQQTLDQMLNQLEQALKNNSPAGKPHSGEPNEADEAMQQLQNMLRSPAMQQAQDMLARMRGAQAAARAHPPGQPGQNQPPMPSQSATSQTGDNPTVNSPVLASLPLNEREAILKMPPRVRDDLMKGLQEIGPEGYRPFIEDYFKRLLESKNP